MCSVARFLWIAVVFAGGAISFPTLAQSDRFVQMPSGGSCWITNTGFVYGCTGDAATNSKQRQQTLQNAYHQGAQAEQQYLAQQQRARQMQAQADIQAQQENAAKAQEYAREHETNEAIGAEETRWGEERRERDGTTSICKTKLADGSVSYGYCKPGSANETNIH